MKKQQGFTIVEILVVVALTAILGLILTNILTAVLRGQNKINTISQVKQNGQLLMDKFTNEIRSAGEIICVGSTSSDPNNSIVILKEANYIRFKFIKPTTSINGYFSREDFKENDIANVVDDLQLCTETGTQRGSFSYLTDKENSGISIDYDKPNGVSQPIFEKQTITPKPGYPILIFIKFRANKGVNAGSAPEITVTEKGVLFTTAVSPRGEQ